MFAIRRFAKEEPPFSRDYILNIKVFAAVWIDCI